MKYLILFLLFPAFSSNLYAVDDAKQQKLDQARAEFERAYEALTEAKKQMIEAKKALYEVEGQRGFLGIIMDPSAEDSNVVISRVVAESGAEKAGVKDGDVLIAVRNKPLFGNDGEEKLRNSFSLFGHIKADETVTLTLQRNGETVDIDVVAQPKPRKFAMLDVPMDLPITHPAELSILNAELSSLDIEKIVEEAKEGVKDIERRIEIRRENEEPIVWTSKGDHALAGYHSLHNIEMAEINADLGKYFGTVNGVLIISAPKDSPFNIQAGDVITKLNGRKIENPRQLMLLLFTYKEGDKIVLKAMREKKEVTIDIEIPKE